MKAPITDTTLGIRPDHSDKFRNVRQKAQDEYIERHKRRKKDSTVIVPKYKVGDVVVLQEGFKCKHYHLAEIVDIRLKHQKDYSYFGIVLKTTDKDMICRIGRLIETGGNGGYWFSPCIENIPADSIKWLDTKGE
jgi:hypothetical protein